jgi:hypothetical protein
MSTRLATEFLSKTERKQNPWQWRRGESEAGEGVSNIDETIDQVSGEKSSPPLSRGKRARYTNI